MFYTGMSKNMDEKYEILFHRKILLNKHAEMPDIIVVITDTNNLSLSIFR